MTMRSRTIILGETQPTPVELFNRDGTRKDMTGLSFVRRLRLKTDTALTASKDSGTADDFTWVDQATGRGLVLWKSDDSLTTGDYWVDDWVYNAATPVDRRKWGGPVIYHVINPKTGAFA